MRSYIITTATALAILGAAGAGGQQYALAGGAATGRITISGGSTLRSWSCDVTRFDASVRSPGLDGQVEQMPNGREQASFDIPVAGIDCRNRTMNSHLRDALYGDSHPNVRFELTGYSLTGESTMRAEGNLTIGTTTTPIAIDAAFVPSEGTLRVQGQKRMRMTELGVRPPTLMLGTLRVHDQVTIGFDLVIRQSAVTLAALSAAGGR